MSDINIGQKIYTLEEVNKENYLKWTDLQDENGGGVNYISCYIWSIEIFKLISLNIILKQPY